MGCWSGQGSSWYRHDGVGNNQQVAIVTVVSWARAFLRRWKCVIEKFAKSESVQFCVFAGWLLLLFFFHIDNKIVHRQHTKQWSIASEITIIFYAYCAIRFCSSVRLLFARCMHWNRKIWHIFLLAFFCFVLFCILSCILSPCTQHNARAENRAMFHIFCTWVLVIHGDNQFHLMRTLFILRTLHDMHLNDNLCEINETANKQTDRQTNKSIGISTKWNMKREFRI